MAITLVWCHGGCFSGGSIDYDKELRNHLSNHNITVIPIDFSLQGWELALKDIYTSTSLKINENDKVILGGISSGALMAHVVANTLYLPAILICPVIKPADRHASLPLDLQTKQLAFFGSMDGMLAVQDSILPPNNRRYILYGTKDIRAPVSSFQQWLTMDNVTYDALDQGHEICSNPPCELIIKRLVQL